MNFKTKALLASCLLATTALPTTAFAASQAECAIWLCLPAGFPSSPSGAPSSLTCGDAKQAMISRIKDLKSPLPAFASCAVPGSSSVMEAKDGMATYVPAHEICTARFGDDERCIRWTTVPEQWTQRRPSVCDYAGRHSTKNPVDCQSVRWVEVHSDGIQSGGRYYFNLNGHGRLVGGDKAIHEYLRLNP